MTLTKQQKFDMIRDVELRLAKEELAEQYVKNMSALENSDKPLRTLQELTQKDAQSDLQIDTPEQKSMIAEIMLHYHQRDQWHDLSERNYEELKSLGKNADLESFAFNKQKELDQLLTIHRREMDKVEQSENHMQTARGIIHGFDSAPSPEIMNGRTQETDQLTNEDKELLELSEIAAKAPFNKASMDSKSQWEFTGIETLARQEMAKEQFGLQDLSDNSQNLSNDNDMGMEM